MIRLVIAEDQLMVLSAIASLLEMERDIEVVGRAANGGEALALVRAHVPDVLITDIEMPVMGGLELAATLRAEGLRTRVIVATTYGRPGYLRRAMDAGVRGYMLKDAQFPELLATLRRVAAGGTAIDPGLLEDAWGVDCDPLTVREREILRHVERGDSNKVIARALDLSPGTVRNYIAEASQKLGAANRIEASLIARQNGWL